MFIWRAWQWIRRYFAPSSEAPLVGKYYVRTGGCTQCGKCCTDIHLVYDELPIASEEEFRRIQAFDTDFAHFKVIGDDDNGLVFQCVHLQEDNSCGVYQHRPLFCRQYPGERSIILGSQLPEECGYQFHLLKTFDEVLAESAKELGLAPVKPSTLQPSPDGSSDVSVDRADVLQARQSEPETERYVG